MYIVNGIIKKMFLEPEEGPDPYGKSDADSMLEFVAPGTPLPHRIALLTKVGCPFCDKAKKMLTARNLPYSEVVLEDCNRSIIIGAITSANTVPQVFINGKLVGGSDQLEEWLGSN